MNTAVLFPGIGYHTDKPLLYYSGKLAASFGYEVIRIGYPACDVNLKEADSSQIHAFVNECIEVAESALKDVDASGDVIFVSKSIGTAVAAACAASKEYRVRHVFFTPLEETFRYVKENSGIAFNGTKDNWADAKAVRGLCEKADIPLTTIEGANHSLETGVVAVDTKNLCTVMTAVESYFSKQSML